MQMEKIVMRRVHSRAESHKLWNHVQANFTAAKENDAEFAAAATKELGFPVTPMHVGEARRGLGIPSWLESRPKVASHPHASGTLYARVSALESKVDDLLKRLGETA